MMVEKKNDNNSLHLLWLLKTTSTVMNGVINTDYSFTKCSKFKQKSGSGAISVWGRNNKDSQHSSALGCTASVDVNNGI